MSQINFDILKARHPELATIWQPLERWFSEHEYLTTINSAAVAAATPSVPPRALARAFFYLVNDGQLEQFYQLETPNGVLVGPLFRSPEITLPETVDGRFDERISTEDCRLVPVFRVLGAKEAVGRSWKDARGSDLRSDRAGKVDSRRDQRDP
jgi:hypothetical protein